MSARAIRLLQMSTGKELCKLYNFEDGSWAVVDPEGRYDGSNDGDVDSLHWVIGTDPVGLMDMPGYYDPRLLAKLTGHLKREPLRDIRGFKQADLAPKVSLRQRADTDPRLVVDLTARGGGIGRVVVLVNGQELTADARGRGVSAEAERATIEIDVGEAANLRAGEDNTIEVIAYTRDGDIREKGAKVRLRTEGTKSTELPHLWAVLVGTAEYQGDALDLAFADGDAEALAEAIGIAGSRMLEKDGQERVHLAVLSTSRDHEHKAPTNANIRAALEIVAQGAKPHDIVLLYFSGHGVCHSGEEPGYYYLTAQASTSDLSNAKTRHNTAFPARELVQRLKQIAANKRVVIFDTCAAGQALEDLAGRTGTISGLETRALKDLRERTGAFLLAGCAGDMESYEAVPYNRGLLTHALLEYMESGSLKNGEYVDVAMLFDYAIDRVEDLAREFHRVQEPRKSVNPNSRPYPIGQLLAEDRKKIPVVAPSIVFMGSQALDSATILEGENADTENISAAIDELLRGRASARGGDGERIRFRLATSSPNAYQVRGTYTRKADAWTIHCTVWKGGVKLAKLAPISTQGADKSALARQVVEAVLASIKK